MGVEEERVIRNVEVMRRLVLDVERSREPVADDTYDEATLRIAAKACVELGLVVVKGDGAVLTTTGHDFASLARNEEVWRRVMRRLAEAGFQPPPLDIVLDQLRGEASMHRYVAGLETEYAKLREFVLWALRTGPFEGGNLDGADVEAQALAHGIIEPREMTEPCREDCMCASVGEFPLTCNRLADWMGHPLECVRRKEG